MYRGAMDLRRRLWETVQDLVFPRICGGCRRPIPEPRERYLCAPCARAAEWIHGTTCRRCDVPTQAPRAPWRCSSCRSFRWAFHSVTAAGLYEGTLRRAILAFKLDRQEQLGRLFARRLLDRLDARGLDFVAPVPIDVWTHFERTFNPAGELAHQIARHLELPCDPLALRRVRQTAPQASLPRARRLRNPAGAFEADPRRVRERRVLLVDDVLTTGATANECSRLLLRAGAREVRVAVAGRARALA